MHVAPRSYRAPRRGPRNIPTGANAAPSLFDFPIGSRGARMYGLNGAHTSRFVTPKSVEPPDYDYFSVRIRDLELSTGPILDDFDYTSKTTLDIAKAVASSRNVPEDRISLYHNGKIIVSRAWNQEERLRRGEWLESVSDTLVDTAPRHL